MNSNVITLDPITTPQNAKTILSKDGFTGSVLTLAPGDETPRTTNQNGEHVLYVVDGMATVRFEAVNTVLSKDEALLIPKGKPHSIAADTVSGAKLFRLEVPPRQIVVPQIISPAR